MRTKRVGAVTDLGMEGADSYLYYFGRLPDYYVSFEVAEGRMAKQKRKFK